MSNLAEKNESKPALRRPRGEPIPAEGENGLFTESWFPICPSFEVKQGQVVGRDFLDGRVVVYRGEDGVAQVLSAYCPHLGADLSVGRVVGNHVRCAFHEWEFDGRGACKKTGIGDPPPKLACLYKFHSIEKFGLIWAFNGAEPWWDIPDFPLSEDELSVEVRYDVPLFPIDPWVLCANTPDWQHIKVVHHVDFDFQDMLKRINFTKHSMEYSFKGVRKVGEQKFDLDWNVGIFGTSMFHMHGYTDGQWYAVLTAFGMPRPGTTQNYIVSCQKKGDGSEESEAQLKMMHEAIFRIGKIMIEEDRPITQTIKYTPGAMTRSDQALQKYLEIVRRFPRSHYSADFIN